MVIISNGNSIDFFIPTSVAYQPLKSKFGLKNTFPSFTYSAVLADNIMEQTVSVVVIIIYYLSLLPLFSRLGSFYSRQLIISFTTRLLIVWSPVIQLLE